MEVFDSISRIEFADHCCRADDQRMALSRLREMGDGGQSLDGLPESHLVADDHLPLADDESSGEVLVLTQALQREQFGVQLDALHLPDQMLG